MIGALAFLAIGLAQQPEQPFSFRGLHVGLSQQEAMDQGFVASFGVKAVGCEAAMSAGRRVQLCALSAAIVNPGVAGLRITGAQAGFGPEGLEIFRLQVAGPDAPAVRAAMAAKFGEPCREATTEWRNLAGAVLENPTSTWCLADGELQVIGRSSGDPDIAEARFVARSSTRGGEPIVDF